MNNNHNRWAQGYFVDQIQYSKWTKEQKDKADYLEKFNVRPSPTGNAICKCSSHEEAKWIALRLNTASNLESENASLKQRIAELEKSQIVWHKIKDKKPCYEKVEEFKRLKSESIKAGLLESENASLKQRIAELPKYEVTK
jgi:hypothetical protein